MIRYLLILVGRVAETLCPAPASVRVAVLAADLLAEREAAVDVMEPWRFGPAAGVATGHGPGVVCADAGFPAASSPTPGRPTYLTTRDWADICCRHPEPTEELLLAAANQIAELCGHVHFNHPKQEYMRTLVHQLHDRATLFAQNR